MLPSLAHDIFPTMPAAKATLLFKVRPVLIILFSFVSVPDYLISLVQLFEFSFIAGRLIRMMLVRTVAEGALPFDPLVPNAETVAAMKAARRGDLVKVGGVADLLSDLNADD